MEEVNNCRIYGLWILKFIARYLLMNIPSEFVCPITLAIMRDPVLAPDGKSYERTAITQWLSLNPLSPLTRQPMSATSLKTNVMLKIAIDNYRSSMGDFVSIHIQPSAPPIDNHYVIQPSAPPFENPIVQRVSIRDRCRSCLCVFICIIIAILIILTTMEMFQK